MLPAHRSVAVQRPRSDVFRLGLYKTDEKRPARLVQEDQTECQAGQNVLLVAASSTDCLCTGSNVKASKKAA